VGVDEQDMEKVLSDMASDGIIAVDEKYEGKEYRMKV
jgi:hypothetical protein